MLTLSVFVLQDVLNECLYTTHVLNTKYFRSCLETQLPGLLTASELTYLEDNFNAFEKERRGWGSEEQPKQEVIPFNFPVDAEARKEKLKALMLFKFGQAREAAVVDFSSF